MSCACEWVVFRRCQSVTSVNESREESSREGSPQKAETCPTSPSASRLLQGNPGLPDTALIRRRVSVPESGWTARRKVANIEKYIEGMEVVSADGNHSI